MTDHSGRIANLEAERDAWIAEHNETIRINLLLRAENAALRKAITDAPHTPECASHRDFCSIPEHGKKACNCWKSRIPAGGLKV